MTTMSEALMPWIRENLGDVGGKDLARPSVRGGHAEIVFFQGLAGSESELVLKVLVYPEESWTLRDEFEALSKMHSAFSSRTDIDCPRPIALHPGGRAYLMTKVDGRPLDRVDLSDDALGRTTDLLLDAMSLYYAAVGDIYGDLQPSNVLVAGGAIALIDPTLPARVHRDIEATLACAPASADIGYWAYSVVSRSFAGFLRHPRVAARRSRATRLLLAKAPEHFGADPDAFRRDVSHAVTARLTRLSRRHPLKGRVLEGYGRMSLARLQKRSR